MGDLAFTNREQGRLEEAEKLGVQVMETRKRVQGPEHLHTLTSMSNLAFTYREQGRLEEAIMLMKICFQIRKRILGSGHYQSGSSAKILVEWRMLDRAMRVGSTPST
jgi:hypothetical protein